MSKIQLNCFLKIPNTWTTEIIGKTGFDYVTIDMQHGLIDFQMLVSMLQSLASSNALTLVRAPWNDPSFMMRALDAGANGVICPMVNSKADAESFVQACLYPPLGIRSFGPTRAKLTGTYTNIAQTNESILTFALIETKEGVENLEVIASTPNLKGLYVGPSDLSISLGLKTIADYKNPELIDVLKKVIEVSKKYKLLTATQVADTEQAKIAKNLGFDIITPIDDNALFENALRERFEDLKRNLFKSN